jgi:hypothetical protein
MARMFICDGCGDEIVSHNGRNEFAVSVVSNSTTKVSHTFDLCRGCGERLVEKADPRKWIRVKAVSPEAA